MTPERWRKIKELYHAAVERDLGERSAFLADACRGDDELQREVEAILVQDSDGASLNSPAAKFFDRSLAAGDQLGPYEIVALLGTGGMGEVYRAIDARLHQAPSTSSRNSF